MKYVKQHFVTGMKVSLPDVLNRMEDGIAAACAAAEAVKDLLVRRNRKRTGFLVVEGTQTEIVRAALFQLHILRNDLYNVVPRGQLVQKNTVKRHRTHLRSVRFAPAVRDKQPAEHRDRVAVGHACNIVARDPLERLPPGLQHEVIIRQLIGMLDKIFI